MAITLETGSGLPDADSLVTLGEVRSYASSRGLTVPGDDAALEILMRKASDYLGTLEARFAGQRSVAGQALPFPRKGLYLHNVLVAEDFIPLPLKRAVCQLVADLVENDPLAVGEGREVLTQTVGPISTTYAQTGKAAVLPVLTKVEAMLKPFFFTGSGRLTADRV